MMDSVEEPPKKIGVFIPTLNSGGAEKVAVALANEFAKQDFVIQLLVVDATGPLRKEISHKVEVVELKAKRLRHSIFGVFKYLIEQKPNALLSMTTDANLVALICNFVLGNQTKLSLSEHTDLEGSLANNSIGKKIIIRALVKLLYPTANAIVAVSYGVGRSISSVCSSSKLPLTVIYNPVVDENFFFRSKESAQHTWLHQKTCPVIVCVGRLSPEKDHGTLLKAFAKVSKILPIKLLIIGEGPERQQIKNMINSLGLTGSIELLGFVSNPLPFIRAADALIVSSKREGFSNVIVEALACNTAVISSDCPSGPSEILEEGKWGELFDVGNSNQLAMKIFKVLEGAKLDTELRGKEFTSSKAAKNYLECFRN